MTDDEIIAALRLCVREHQWGTTVPALTALVENRDLQRLARLAALHRITNLLYLSIRSSTLTDEQTLIALARFHERNLAKHMRTLQDLAALARVLDAAGIRWLTFKGPVAAVTLYPREDLRAYSDLDVLVQPENFPEAVRVLEESGARLLDRNWKFLRADRSGQLHLMLPLGTTVDLHWHLLNSAAIRQSLPVGMEDIWRRSRSVSVGEMRVQTFEAFDALLHFCIHAGLAGATRLLWLKDVERCIAVWPPSWDDVIDRARQWRATRLVGAVLARSKTILGAAVPDDVIASLVPSALRRRLNHIVDSRWPPELDPAARGPATYWVQFARDDLVASAMGLRGRTRASARRRWYRCKDRFRNATPTPVPLVDTGGESGRSAFFEEVRPERSAVGRRPRSSPLTRR